MSNPGRHDSAGPDRTDRARRRGFVGLLWVILLIADLALVVRFGPDVPRWDDFDVVPVLTGDAALSAGWLWSQHNEHRVPLPRLVLLAAYRLSGPGFPGGHGRVASPPWGSPPPCCCSAFAASGAAGGTRTRSCRSS